MGTCAMGKPETKSEDGSCTECIREYFPLYMLKQELMYKIDLTDDHAYKIFCTWRFKNSVRRDQVFQKKLNQNRQQMLDSFNFQSNDKCIHNQSGTTFQQFQKGLQFSDSIFSARNKQVVPLNDKKDLMDFEDGCENNKVK